MESNDCAPLLKNSAIAGNYKDKRYKLPQEFDRLMTASFKTNRLVVPLGVTATLLAILFFVGSSPLLIMNDAMSLAVTVDLLVSVPVIYLLLIRQRAVSKSSVLAVFLAGLLVGTFALPEANRYYLDVCSTWLVPLAEVGLLLTVILKFRAAWRKNHSMYASAPDFYSRLKKVCHEVLPKFAAAAFATEIAVFYYCFFCWKRRPLTESKSPRTAKMVRWFCWQLSFSCCLLKPPSCTCCWHDGVL